MSTVKFGTGGFRGIIGDSFTKENVQKICQAIANIAEKKELKKEICIGYDYRFMSENFAIWCAEVFAGNNFHTELFKTATSTPVAMYASKKNKNPYGIMITASHNPYLYNGVKVFTKEGKDASIEETKEIEDEFNSLCNIKTTQYEAALNKNIFIKDYMEEFVDSIITNQDIPNCNNIKVVFDAKFGSTVDELNTLANKIGLLNYQIINSSRDAFFNFITPAPNSDNIEQLKSVVLNTQSDIGFALDADGDRLAIIDNKGNYIDNNYILALVYYYLVKYKNKHGDSVKNIATSNLLNVITEKLGYSCHETPVGFKYISSKLIEKNAVVGGESSGGLAIQNHIWGKDSLISIALVLKIITKLNKSFCEIIEELLHFANDYKKIIKDKQYSYTQEQEKIIKSMVFDKKAQPIHRYELKDIIYSDYAKFYYKNDNWALVRFSGTEPILRIFVEADTEVECDNMIKDWEQLLNL